MAARHQHRDDDRYVSHVFVIQNTQTRDTQTIQLKLDELIRVDATARNVLINLEDMSDDDLERMKAAFVRLASIEIRKPLERAPNPSLEEIGDPPAAQLRRAHGERMGDG